DVSHDTHVWADEYDRDLDQVFAIQSEIAKTVAQQLNAKIAPEEKRALERPITSNLVAFELYARARDLSLGGSNRIPRTAHFFRASDVLSQAIAAAPTIFSAYCLPARPHARLVLLGHPHPPARLALAEGAIEKAIHLRPDAGEAHAARAEVLYRAHLD